MSEFDYVKDESGIVTITMDMAGPVNTMNATCRQLMNDCVTRLEQETDLSGVILASAKSTFFAGGDLKELYSVPKGEEAALLEIIELLKGPLRRLEKLPVPVVAAINGAALGGGFEICLACNHRIIVNKSSAIVGLPEVTLGLLPGAGGVVRMINLLGLEQGLPYLLEGKKLKPAQALDVGLVDEMVESVDELVSRAKAWIKANPDASLQPWDTKGYKIPGGNIHNPRIVQTLQAAPVMLYTKTRGLLPAPERILSVATDAVTVDFDTALKSETRGLAYLVTTPQAKNIINSMFFQLNRINAGVSRPKGPEKQVVKRVGIIGAGAMGQAIAYVSAKAGVEVILKSSSLASAEKGKAYSEKLVSKLVEKGRMGEDKKQAVLALIKPTDSYSELSGCDLIIEAVPENMTLKSTVLKDIEPFLGEGVVVGSNTSTLPISQLAESSGSAANVIGIHFFSPADKMPLVEIICGEKTSDETLAKAFDYARQVGKTPIVVNDSLGFYTSRVFLSFLDEGVRMLEEGISPVVIDRMGQQIGMPVGPLAAQDEVSQSLIRTVRETHSEMGVYGSKYDIDAAARVAETMINSYQRAGRHQGGGFYEYPESDDKKPGDKHIWPKLFELYQKADVTIPEQDMKDRILFRQVIESIKSLQEGVLRSVADGNIGSIFGIGAPVWTGGFIQFVNTYGLQQFVDRCEQLSAAYGDRFNVPELVKQKLAAGELFE
ncbi:MAG: 3-hydroxyacyl-CoA dehydrogenase NAD-binding domain-containing protein [Porticoccaceae bacterium]|nr:enoyl-CoA hydratase/isomerase family protein [Pseudomonadales bacterium]MCP5172390.1 enoyl-CoA hydratase/isomerase family protein [Pseudomonadales bacterium]